jgi:ABC-2 type transport system permease protein
MSALTAVRRKAAAYATLAAIMPKMYLAYTLWFWVGLVLNLISMTVFVFFWRGVYANTTSINGLGLQTTLNYILLAQVFGVLTDGFLVWEIGQMLRQGSIAHLLLRPLDLQASYYVLYLSSLATQLLMQLPIAVVATLLFGLRWPNDPAVWGAFVVTALLGRTVLYFFDWLLACITFYTTEVWGLSVLVFGLGLFLSGALVPLQMMPDWLQRLVLAVPFAQILAVPLSVLSGIAPIADAPRLWLGQLAWIVGLFVAARLFFRVAVRKVTVQGG